MLTNKKRKQIIAGIVAVSMVTALTSGCGVDDGTTTAQGQQTQQTQQDNGFFDNLMTFGLGYALGHLMSGGPSNTSNYVNSAPASSTKQAAPDKSKDKDKTIRAGYVPATTTKATTNNKVEAAKSTVTSKVPSAGSGKTGISSGSSRSSAVS